eukprot:GEMP01006282.1.p1 GENE.GEMP01006282.1~~GEMP01006282.1.p1  ORF type:complete len:559 (-),score=93.20 GEMP01006282.1:2001-3677(-)
MLPQWLEERALYGRKQAVPPYGSLVSRLTLKQMFSGHSGCVNSLQWNYDQTLLISGSDDKRVLLWTVGPEKHTKVHDVQTQHQHNIFDARLNKDQTHLATCGADGRVTVVAGVCAGSIKASRIYFDPMKAAPARRFMANKLTWVDDHVFMVSFGDGSVRQIDIRTEPDGSDKTVVKFERAARPIEICPFDSTKVAIGGGDIYVKVIDRRYTYADSSLEGNFVAYFSHPKFDQASRHRQLPSYPACSDICISSLEWGPRGQLLANYRCEDLVVFDGSTAIQQGFHGLSTDYVVQTYTGRENVQTIAKEARFIFGGTHIMTGGDCGGIFIWDVKHSEPVRRLHADRCCVNCVLPHDGMQYILSSGIDDEIKMWDVSTQRRPLNQIKSFPAPIGGFNERMDAGPGNLMDAQAKTQLEKCEELKALGNGFTKAGNHEAALEKYSEALRAAHFVSHNVQIEAQQKQISVVLSTNQALCHFHLQKYHEAIECCNNALMHDQKHLKALFRKAQAYVALKELQNAEEVLRLVDGNDTAVVRLRKEIEQKNKAQYEQEKRQCRRMFG